MQDDTIQTIAVYLAMSTTNIGPAFPTKENAEAYLAALEKDPVDEYWVQEVGVVRFVQQLEPVEILMMPKVVQTIDHTKEQDSDAE